MMIGNTWFLLIDGANKGSYNMALDEFLWELVEKEPAKVFLRFYGWDKPTMSLGMGQKLPLHPQKLADNGVSIVRRATGGRAVLHFEELTYSIIAPISQTPWNGTITQSCNLVAEAFGLGLQKLGIEYNISGSEGYKDAKQIDMGLCFLSSARGELITPLGKILGSAQKRGLNALLQHGSMPYTNSYKQITSRLYADHPHIAQSLNSSATDMNELTGQKKSFSDWATYFSTSFAEYFDVNFEPVEFNSIQKARIQTKTALKEKETEDIKLTYDITNEAVKP
jgi:lipoyl(octanoyl) transferase